MKHYRDYISLKFINALSEFVLITVAYFLSGLIRFYLGGGIIRRFAPEDIIHFLPFCFCCSLVSVLLFAVLGDYSTVRVKNVHKEIARVFFIQMVSGMTIAGALFLTQGSQFSRVWLVLFIIISIVFLILKRIVFSVFSLYWCRKNQGLSHVLIVGEGNNARRYYRGMENEIHKECEYVGNIAPVSDPQIPSYLGTYDMINEIIDRTGADEAVVCSEIEEKTLNKLLIACAIKSVMVYIVPSYNDYLSGGRILSTYGDLNMIEVSALRVDNILGVNISVTNMESTIQTLTENIKAWKGQYICVSNVHTTVMAHENPEYMKIQNEAVMALPDGSPLSSYSRERGKTTAKRVTGPDLMREILIRSKDNGFTHFFYGSTEDTLKNLKEKIEKEYPGAQIVGMISPPFRQLTEEEDLEYVKQINDSNADFVWVGLGAPKQEIWMADHKGRINSIMIGVGAAFDFESGNIKRAPKWIQNMKLEWLYRIFQDPKRLFKRYFVTNIKYLWLTRK
ncbi:MAG: WecB/TagA/CpsF family glycosyltransferase [Lachnospiraceae bacterium]|nr:WecB/TagA/CpsF family glycosyltransferase [Lachnospiraceae bacterium]